MHVAVFADLEGAFGIWRMRQCRTGTAEWQYGRECLTADVNAVVRGAFDGGADHVTVTDTHDTGYNCLRDRLDPRAHYVGGHHIRPTFFGDLTGVDLVLYVAIHAASGTPDAFFPHTHYGVFSRFSINDRPICEMDLYGGVLGELGIPVGFVSGEAIAVEQALQALPWARTVEVDKHKETYLGPGAAEVLAEGHARLAATAAEAVLTVSAMTPLVLDGPLRFETVFRSEELAAKFNTWNFDADGATVRFDAPTMTEGFEALNKLTFFPRRIYPVRRAVLAAMRARYSVRSRHFAPAPNREGAPDPGATP
jgi:D-amino peptidase